jgi:NADH:ubiquinone oxidoreductase subunit 5 (subunit L)/multisubunit Na+/H+ antiporter MnhA subunit
MIGISSFLLINFFHLRISVNFSAYKAFIFNKISDGFVLFYIIYKETSFIDDITLYTGDFYVDKPVVGVLCLVIAGSCKSAQLGLHV